MIPGGATQGHGEILAIISRARNGAEAATAMEKAVRQWSLPRQVEAQCVQVLATATDYNSAINGLDSVMRSSGTQLSQQTLQQFQNSVAWAYQNQQGLRNQYGR